MLTIQELEALRGLVQINVNINLPKGHHMAYDQVRLPFSWRPLSITGVSFLPGSILAIAAPAGVTYIDIDGWTEAKQLSVSGSDLVTLSNLSITKIGVGIPDKHFSCVIGGASLASVNLGPLTSIDGDISLPNNAALTSLRMPSLSVLGGDVNCNACALSETSVDHVLAILAVATSDGVTPWAGNADLADGTSAPPSAAGLVNKGIIEANGGSVGVNS